MKKMRIFNIKLLKFEGERIKLASKPIHSFVNLLTTLRIMLKKTPIKISVRQARILLIFSIF